MIGTLTHEELWLACRSPAIATASLTVDGFSDPWVITSFVRSFSTP